MATYLVPGVGYVDEPASSGTYLTPGVGYVEFTVASAGQAISPATEADAAQALAGQKQDAIANAAETGSTQALTGQKSGAISPASEANAAQAFTSQTVQAISPATETGEAQQLLSGDLISPTEEADAAQALTGQKAADISPATTSDAAQALTGQKAEEAGISIETDTARALTAQKLGAIQAAMEADGAQPIIQAILGSIQAASEADGAQSLTAQKLGAIGTATETDSVVALIDATAAVDPLLGEAMNTSIVQICNMAIGHIGGKNYAQTVFPSPGNSREERLCHTFYTLALYATLEDRDWKFASKTTSLALIGTAPDRWSYQYAWPAGCLIPREIIQSSQPADPIPFDVGLSDDELTKYIWTDQEDAELRFTAEVLDPTLYSSAFVDALAWRLAAYLAAPLKGNSKLQGGMFDGYNASVANVGMNNANIGKQVRRTTPRRSTAAAAR